MDLSLITTNPLVFGAVVAFCGALIGALTATFTQRYTLEFADRRDRRLLVCRKLERVYLLCQQLYEGYQEVGWLRERWLPGNPQKFLDRYRHPGRHMNEIKLIIRAYGREIIPKLDKMDERGHAPLKKMYQTLREKVSEVDPGDSTSLASLGTYLLGEEPQFEQHLRDLGVEMDNLKWAIVDRIDSLATIPKTSWLDRLSALFRS